MSSMLISIIVPVYNSERWLKKCIDSVLNQSYRNFELIVVDDGSIDASFSIMQQYASVDSRIRIYHKDNSGVSDTRNFGLSLAKGEWVAFIDSDDSVTESFLNSMLPTNEQVDLVVCGARIYKNSKSSDNLFVNGKELENGVYNISDIYNCFTNQVFNGPVRKLFRRETIAENGIKFPLNKSYGEDTDFVYSYLNYVNSIQVVNDYSYQIHLVNDQSLSMIVNAADYYATIKHNYKLYLDFLQKKYINDSRPVETYYDYNILMSASLSYWRKKSLKYNERIRIYKELYCRCAWNRIKVPVYFYFLGKINCWMCFDVLRRIHYALVIVANKILHV